jgi:hypothetical protein
MTLLSYFSLRRVAGVNEHELKKRDAKYTRASVVMVIVFVVCNTPRSPFYKNQFLADTFYSLFR